MGLDALAAFGSSGATERERIRDFNRHVMRGSASRVIPVIGGFAVLNSQFTNSYEHNCLVVDAPLAPGLLMQEADRVLEGAGLSHRAIELEMESVERSWLAQFQACGYDVERTLTMVLRRATERSTSTPVERVPYEELKPVVEAGWRRAFPQATDLTIRQLVDRRSATYRACEVTHHAVRGPDGFVARCDLYRIPPIAQVESVETEPEWRSRGYATAVVLDAIDLAQESGCDLIFLIADADDWPQYLYRQLWFERVGGGYTLQRGEEVPGDGHPAANAATR